MTVTKMVTFDLAERRMLLSTRQRNDMGVLNDIALALTIAARLPKDVLDHSVEVSNDLDGPASVLGLLHDTVEEGVASQAEIASIFPEDITTAMVAITRLPDETYASYIDRLKVNPLAVKVKRVDLAKNLARPNPKGSLRARYLRALATLAQT